MKTIHIHLGPHKTGSSAIQKFLQENKQIVFDEAGIHVLEAKHYSSARQALTRGDISSAAFELQIVAAQIEELDCKEVILSAEDFSGRLPGRSRQNKPYPALWENISAIKSAFSEYRCLFYFFVRDPTDWLKSAYTQNIKYGKNFSGLNQYTDFVKVDELWSDVLIETQQHLGLDLKLIEYSSDRNFSSVKALLSEVTSRRISVLKAWNPRVNVSPPADAVRLLELVNEARCSSFARKNARHAIRESSSNSSVESVSNKFLAWPPLIEAPKNFPDDLDSLWKRSTQRVRSQTQNDLLPAIDADLKPYRYSILEPISEIPSVGRGRMENQAKLLEYRFQNRPHVCFLLGIIISYLRRDTKVTKKARILFQRLWIEEYHLLLAMLPTRWLISTLQTFLEHGANEDQRIIGASGFFFANLMKAYEAERSLEGLAADSVYPSTTPTTKNGFAGLDRIKLGGSDLMLNTNAQLLELSSRERTAGRVLEEFLLRMKSSSTVFSRMDKSRQAHQVEIEGFKNCWSFFSEPK